MNKTETERQRLIELRKACGLRFKKDAAELLGCCAKTYERYERGEQPIPKHVFELFELRKENGELKNN